MIFTVLVASAGIYFGCKINLMISFYFTLRKNLAKNDLIIYNISFTFDWFRTDQFLRSHLPHTEAVFRGSFTVTDGDYLPEGVAEIGSYVHIEKARFYQHKLDLVFNGSPLASKYVHNEVFLLEG